MFKNLMLAGSVLAVLTSPCFAADQEIIGLITKTNINPFFVKMKEGAEAKAKELGVTLQAYAGQGRWRQRRAGPGDRGSDRGRRQGLHAGALATRAPSCPR